MEMFFFFFFNAVTPQMSYHGKQTLQLQHQLYLTL